MKKNTQTALEKVRQEFDDWRETQSKRRTIPESLWKAAIALHPQYSIYEIAKALRLDYSKLKRLVLSAVEKKNKDNAGFTGEKARDGRASYSQNSLEEVLQKFEDWRAEKGKHRSIPKSLWKAAIALHPRYNICKIAKILRLEYHKLKRLVLRAMDKKEKDTSACMMDKKEKDTPACMMEKKKDTPAFIQLNVPVRPPTQMEWTIEMENRDGGKIKICSQSAQMPDFVAVCQNFIRAKP
jgi:hypothetical protein